MACYCCVLGCKNNNHKVTDKHFFRFPKNDPKRQKLWKKFARKNMNKTSVICEDHFDCCFFIKKDKKVKLTSDAVPTIFYKKIVDGIEKVTIDFDGENYVGAAAEAMEKENESSQDQEIVAIETAFINEQVKLDELKLRCRFCAENKDEVIEISSFATLNIDIDKLLRFLNLHIIDSDFFPNSVCEECFNHVINLETFIVKCKSADQWLWEEIGKLETISAAILSPQKTSESQFYHNASHGNLQQESFDEIIEKCELETDEPLHLVTETSEMLAPKDEIIEHNVSFNEIKTFPVMDPSCNKFARKSYSCEVCLVVFAGLKTYRSHICDVPEVRCSDCNDTFKTVFDLKKHRKFLHTENLQKHYCSMCKQVITGRLTVFKKHKTKCNRGIVGEIKCEFCHKVRISKNSNFLKTSKTFYRLSRRFTATPFINYSTNQAKAAGRTFWKSKSQLKRKPTSFANNVERFTQVSEIVDVTLS